MAHFYIKYMDACSQLEGKGRDWAFKDPRTTILHSIWSNHFDVIIGMFRAPQEVVASYVGQGWVKGLRKGHIALNYWKRFNQSLLHIYEYYKGNKPIYVLDYNDDATAQASILLKKLEVPLTDDAKALFNPSLKHYSETKLPNDRTVCLSDSEVDKDSELINL